MNTAVTKIATEDVVRQGVEAFATTMQQLEAARSRAGELEAEVRSLNSDKRELRQQILNYEAVLRTARADLADARQRGDHYMAQAMSLLALITSLQSQLDTGFDKIRDTLVAHAPLPPEPENRSGDARIDLTKEPA